MAQETVEKQAAQKQPKQAIMIDQRVMIIGMAAIVVCAVVALLFALMVIRNSGNAENPASAENELSYIGPLFEVGELATNLAPGGDSKFIRVKVVLELSDKTLEAEVNEKLPVLKDRVLIILNAKSSHDLYAEKRSALKDEIQKDLNRYLTKGKIKQIYFSDLVMQ